MASSPSTRAWAERLLASEAATNAPEAPHFDTVEISPTLRLYLTRLVGADGYVALLRRALSLARSEESSLQGVQVLSDGRIVGFDATNDLSNAAIAITAHLLDILVGLIGESLTHRLMHDVFPEATRAPIGALESFS